MKIYTLLVLVLLSACSSSEQLVSHTGVKKIKFGSGGGVTGAQTIYALNAKAELYQNDTLLKKITPQKTKYLFEKAGALREMKLEQPGNLYSFIEIKTPTATNRIVWQAGRTDIPKEITQLYNALQQIVK